MMVAKNGVSHYPAASTVVCSDSLIIAMEFTSLRGLSLRAPCYPTGY